MPEHDHSTHECTHIIYEIGPNLDHVIRHLAIPIFNTLNRLEEKINKMPTQAEFDAQVAGINDSITALTAAVAAEAAQVQAFIDAHPDLNTSALATIKSNLDALSTSVAQIDPQDVPAPTTAPTGDGSEGSTIP